MRGVCSGRKLGLKLFSTLNSGASQASGRAGTGRVKSSAMPMRRRPWKKAQSPRTTHSASRSKAVTTGRHSTAAARSAACLALRDAAKPFPLQAQVKIADTRIALAGTLKAGKSTLVNALVGEDIAPTDATEATRLVTWFRHGMTPRVTANHRDGRRTDVPITRGDGLTFDLARYSGAQGAANVGDIVDLDVQWPAAELEQTTIIDTPGTSSLSRW